jgi:predicted transglutaminase-like cysteine proteinase
MINLWVLKIIYKLELISKDILNKKINTVINGIKNVKNMKWESWIFGTQYFGKFEDYIVSKKIEKQEKEFSYPYYPANKISK